MASETKKLRWGILGPGGIAQAFRDGVKGSRTGQLVAIATRDPSKPGLADTFPGARILAGYDALLSDPEVDAIYIATPHPGHAEWAIKAAEAGKHVLVEKPMALSAFEIDAIFHAHRKAGTFAGEAFMYRLHPATIKLGELISSGAIGDVRMIQSSFGFQMPKFMPEHRLFANDLAGGGILDVGGYPVSMARFIAGAAVGQAIPRSRQGFRRSPPRSGRDRRMVGRPARIRQRHHRSGLLRRLGWPRQCAAHPRHNRPN